jgi:FKBP-type peptidyl-prolyl cis-trans isomerase FkpA
MNAAPAWGNGPKPRLSDNATAQLVPEVKPPLPHLHKNHLMNTFLIPRAAALSLVLLACTPTWAQNTVTAAAAQEPGAQLKASGMVFRSLKDGTGASPKASDTVKVHYRGTLPDGKEFDSSYKRNEAIEFPLSRVIPCWTEGVQLMKVGGKAKLTCPPATAYGDRGAGGVIPPKATLLFEVELLAINGK